MRYSVTNNSGASLPVGGVLIANGASIADVDLTSGEANALRSVVGVTLLGLSALSIQAASFTRPGDTTAYAVGDLVANSVTAGSVVPLAFSFPRASNGGKIQRVILRKSGVAVANASFRVHFFKALPAAAAGDNAAWSVSKFDAYLGSADVSADRAFSDGASGFVALADGQEINFPGQSVFAVVEARAAYTPGNAEVFTVEAEAEML